MVTYFDITSFHFEGSLFKDQVRFIYVNNIVSYFESIIVVVLAEKIMRQEIEKTGCLCITIMYQGRECIIEPVVDNVVSFTDL